MKYFAAIGLSILAGLWGVGRCRASEIDSPMYQLPHLPFPPVIMVFPEKAKGLWMRALERPEADLRRQAASAVVDARRRGVQGLETTVAPLHKVLDQDNQHPTVRLAAAQALLALEARQTAASLLRQAQTRGGALRDLVEPAMARWDYKPARTLWLERLADPKAGPRDLVLAARGLAAVREAQAADRLRALIFSSAVPAVRHEAALALGAIRRTGLEADAGRLAAEKGQRGLAARLAAAALLQHHQGKEAVALLLRLGHDPEPAVAALAMTRLIDIDVRAAVSAVGHLLASGDPRLRSLGVEVLFREPTKTHLRLLADRLDDVHPEVRLRARRRMIELGKKKELREGVLTEGMRLLQGRSWRGLEQAAFLLTYLEHRPAGERLAELLTFDRPEVYVTAAWSLRRLAVPETLPAVTAYVQEELGRALKGRTVPGRPTDQGELIDHQLSQLNQLLGQQKYAPAEPVLRRYVPRPDDTIPVREARAAAIWALGLLHADKPEPSLVKAVVARLMDFRMLPMEDTRVRQMSAITLGRMKAKEALPNLRECYPLGEPGPEPVNNASGWAIAQITGEKMAPARTVYKVWRDWFLGPHE